MNIKNFNIYTIKPENIAELKNAFLTENLDEFRLKPRHKTQETSTGLGSILSSDIDPDLTLILDIGGAVIFKISQEKAVINSGAIEIDAARAIAKAGDIDKGQQYEIKNRIKAEHIAQAKTELLGWLGWFDYTAGLLFIGANGAGADHLTAFLRGCLGALPASIITTKYNVGEILTRVLHDPKFGGKIVETPQGGHAYQVAVKTWVKLNGLDKSEISIKDADDTLIDYLVTNGYTVSNAEICLNGRATLKTDEKLQIKSFKIDGEQVQKEDISDDLEGLEWQRANVVAGAFLFVSEARIAIKTLIDFSGGRLIEGLYEDDPGDNLTARESPGSNINMKF